MSIITDDSTFFGFISNIQWLGQYAASTGTQDITNAPAQTTTVVDINSYAKLTHGFTTYYKMQGFNNNTQRYEVWFSTGTALLQPPSGNRLSNIEVVLTWTDR